MIRTFLVALVAALASLGSSYAVGRYVAARRAAPHEAHAEAAVEQKKTRIINVPILAKGQVQGYVVAQFLYSVDVAAMHKTAASPEPYILDEAFRMIYGDERLDFAKLKRVDLGKFTAELRLRVAKRLGSDAIREILVQDFNYVSKDDIRK